MPMHDRKELFMRKIGLIGGRSLCSGEHPYDRTARGMLAWLPVPTHGAIEWMLR
jgi:hypothetical protein